MLLIYPAFVRSDAVNLSDGKVWNMGNWGNGWSRTARSSANAYHLAFNPTEVYPSNSNNRWNGLPLRWVFTASVPIFNPHSNAKIDFITI